MRAGSAFTLANSSATTAPPVTMTMPVDTPAAIAAPGTPRLSPMQNRGSCAKRPMKTHTGANGPRMNSAAARTPPPIAVSEALAMRRRLDLADGVGQEGQEPRPLDRLGQRPLFLGRDRGDAARHDLAALGNETRK